MVLGFKLFSCFDDGKADGASAVFCREDFCDEIGFYLVLVAGFDGDDFSRDFISVEPSPSTDDLFYGRDEIFGGQNCPGRLATEFSVGEVIGDACCVVHVAVCEEDVINWYDLIGGFSYIKADIELRHSDDSFFTGNGVADDIKVINFNFRQPVTWHNKASKYFQNIDVRSIRVVCQRLFEVLRAR